jgi:hypothetical protein
MILTQYDPVENPLALAMSAAKIGSGRKGTDMQHPIENSAGLYRLFNAIPDDVKRGPSAIQHSAVAWAELVAVQRAG